MHSCAKDFFVFTVCRNITDIRCIVFVERVITAVVLRSLLNKVFPKYNGWKAEYIAGGSSSLHSQTRKRHNEIIKEFSEGKVQDLLDVAHVLSY